MPGLSYYVRITEIIYGARHITMLFVRMITQMLTCCDHQYKKRIVQEIRNKLR